MRVFAYGACDNFDYMSEANWLVVVVTHVAIIIVVIPRVVNALEQQSQLFNALIIRQAGYFDCIIRPAFWKVFKYVYEL